MGWEQDLLAFCERLKQKKAVRKTAAALRVKGGKGGGSAEDEHQAREEVLKKVLPTLRGAIIERIPSMWRSAMFEQLGEPTVTGDGKYEFTVRFNPRAVFQRSLYAKNPENLQNVVAYLSHGAKPSRHAVFGAWEGHEKQGRTGRVKSFVYLPKGYSRAPDPFLRDAVAQLNAALKKDGITVTLGSAY